ncbi:hypothetical protein [Streptomyces sp. NPDC051636]|uniref:hypothetical protein n=1 Tax=Streptomyces sp. NPDC051636 TaxID=3365663 RepID=UPI0037BBECD9
MPLQRAAQLRDALESALGEPVHLLATDRGYRIIIPAPDSTDHKTWADLLTALRTADRWGSTDTADVPEVWAEVEEK